MWSKRIYKCLYNRATSNFEVHVTDENGLSVRRLNTDSRKDALAFFYVIRDTLAKNNRIRIKQIDAFHFVCKKSRELTAPQQQKQQPGRRVAAIAA